ncbi:MAG: four helix bundle suffix domain-containing protein [Victivallis vadensis]
MEIAANGILSLLNLAILLLERQLAAQVRGFERNGGFSEHFSRVRKRALSGCR